tara:strand:- start:1013 stop:1540 length:528 start_codon:yes stop_codon:yes gene_type:complete
MLDTNLHYKLPIGFSGMVSRRLFQNLAATVLFHFIITIGNTGMAQGISSTTNIVRNPTGSYTQRSVEIPAHSRILYISGQTATDENGYTPADVNIQADIVYEKLGKTLQDAGMTWDDVVKTTVFLVETSDVTAIYKAGAKHNPGGVQAGTLVYVKALALPEVLVELEAVAAKRDK